MSIKVEVCQLDDLVPYSGCCALVEGQQVALFRVDEGETVYAIGNYDPIGDANVLSRGLLAEVNGVITVASPLYKQHYCLTTGQCLDTENVRVPAYAVSVEDGAVYVSIPQADDKAKAA